MPLTTNAVASLLPGSDNASATGVQHANPHARLGNGSSNGLELMTATAAPETTVFTLSHDSAGRLSQRGGQAYVFDALDRLVEVVGRERYLYDGHGRRVRIQRLSDNKPSYPIYSLSGQLLVEDDRRSNTLTEYVPLDGRLVAKRVQPLNGAGTASGAAYMRYLHTDLLGSPVAETDTNGNVSRIERYTPYGEASDGVMDGGAGYTGHANDSLTGLVYMQQRYYDPVVGRFLSVDPVTASGNTGANFNRYWYANNNPYKFTDPDGRAAETVWDALNIGIGLKSGYDNIQNGNYGAAAVDGLGVLADTAATAIPFVPGGAGAGIKAYRIYDRVRPMLRVAGASYGQMKSAFRGVAQIVRRAGGADLSSTQKAGSVTNLVTNLSPGDAAGALKDAGFKITATNTKNGPAFVATNGSVAFSYNPASTSQGVPSIDVQIRNGSNTTTVMKIRLGEP